mmetsp:Transcript_52499/g.170520  ORF Transcript_52499/g.170520 Transcript_52499/m.170520 type:complete len:226 (+) Transcript_52499:109-786(+)
MLELARWLVCPCICAEVCGCRCWPARSASVVRARGPRRRRSCMLSRMHRCRRPRCWTRGWSPRGRARCCRNFRGAARLQASCRGAQSFLRSPATTSCPALSKAWPSRSLVLPSARGRVPNRSARRSASRSAGRRCARRPAGNRTRRIANRCAKNTSAPCIASPGSLFSARRAAARIARLSAKNRNAGLIVVTAGKTTGICVEVLAQTHSVPGIASLQLVLSRIAK